MASFPTSTTPNLGDLIVVGQGASVEPGLYVVLNTTAPYIVASAVGANPARSSSPGTGTVAQANVLSVYRSA